MTRRKAFYTKQSWGNHIVHMHVKVVVHFPRCHKTRSKHASKTTQIPIRTFLTVLIFRNSRHKDAGHSTSYFFEITRRLRCILSWLIQRSSTARGFHTMTIASMSAFYLTMHWLARIGIHDGSCFVSSRWFWAFLKSFLWLNGVDTDTRSIIYAKTFICKNRTVPGSSLTMRVWRRTVSTDIGLCYHNYTDTGRRLYDMWSRKEKLFKKSTGARAILKFAGDLQISENVRR